MLPAGLFSRRVDTGAVIAAALGLAATGLGFRRVAVRVGRAESTVRDWLQAGRRIGGLACALFAVVVLKVGVDPAGVRVRRTGQGLVGLVEAGEWLAVCLAQRWRQPVVSWWVAAAGVCRCRFLQVSWWDQGPQHESVLPSGLAGWSGWMTSARTAGRVPSGP